MNFARVAQYTLDCRTGDRAGAKSEIRALDGNDVFGNRSCLKSSHFNALGDDFVGRVVESWIFLWPAPIRSMVTSMFRGTPSYVDP
jgi:hypothetical protein